MKVLSIEQMTKLKELGVDTSKASMAIYNIYAGEKKEYDILSSNGAFPEKQEHDRFGYGIHNIVAFDKKPVFTLQDIIELLPKRLMSDFGDADLIIQPNMDATVYVISYEHKNDIIAWFYDENILDAAYQMLIWVIENGYLKTKVDDVQL